jgi:thymidylate kinase
MFVSVDGLSGAGKSTIAHHLAQLLVAAGTGIHVTAELSRSFLILNVFGPSGLGIRC